MTAGSRAKWPNDAPLAQFLSAAKRCAGKGSYIFDGFDHTKSYNELIADVLRLARMMCERLPASAFDERGLLHRDAPHVCILGKGGYEFIVAIFAVYSLAGSVVPLSPEILPEELASFIHRPKAACVLTAERWIDRAEKAVALTKKQKDHDVISLVIPCDSEPLEEISIEIDESLVISPEDPALIIFTSGTTGAPKGVVHPRRTFVGVLDNARDEGRICFSPPQWMGGFVNLIYPPLQGCILHIPMERATAKELWDIFLKNTIHTAPIPPALLRLMKEYVETLSAAEQKRHFDSMKSLKMIMTAGSLLAQAVVDFWVFNTGVPLTSVYATSELGIYSFLNVLTKGSQITNSIGKPVKGVKVKLSEGDKGELLVRTPTLMTHYLDDEELTKEAFDEEGYFKTGDYAEMRDGEYFFLGRTSTDHIRFRSFSIHAVKVEIALTGLPYVADACVVGVQDHEVKQLCAAVVRLTPEAQAKHAAAAADQESSSGDRITLRKISQDLRESLPLYMHPRLLRLIGSMSELPLSSSQKPLKAKIVTQCFGESGYWDAAKPMPDVEYSGNGLDYVEADAKPWDWNGRQY